MQILDDGRITDAKGRTVNFKNTVIILTSNIGSQMILDVHRKGEFGFEGSHGKHTKTEEEETVKSKIMEMMKDRFKPEFLNRIDEIIIFKALGQLEIEQIVDLQLKQVEKRLLDNKINLNVDAGVKKYLAKKGFDPDYGARPLKRVIQTELLDVLALKIIEGKVIAGQTVSAKVTKDKITVE